MLVVDISIVLTGLPSIQADLSFSHADLSWVQNAYTLAFGGFLLLGARAGDILGRRRMFIAGLTLFTAASMAIGLAPSPAWLLMGRAVQGVGAAVLAPSTLALLSIHFAEGPARTRALALYAAAAGVGASLGLVLGGLVAELTSWRVGFFINLPIGIALVLGARRYLAGTPLKQGRLDIAGALSSTLGMSALVFGIVRAAAHSSSAFVYQFRAQCSVCSPHAFSGWHGGVLVLHHAVPAGFLDVPALACGPCIFADYDSQLHRRHVGATVDAPVWQCEVAGPRFEPVHYGPDLDGRFEQHVHLHCRNRNAYALDWHRPGLCAGATDRVGRPGRFE